MNTLPVRRLAWTPLAILSLGVASLEMLGCREAGSAPREHPREVATVVSPAPAPQATAPKCDVTASFGMGGPCLGTDHRLAEAVVESIRTHNRTAEIKRVPWGREGEFDLCIATASADEAQRVFERVRRFRPMSRCGGTSVKLGGDAPVYLR